ncbi:MAG TPA: hypothetical protein VI299_27450 [Polyangiales bacterium]
MQQDVRRSEPADVAVRAEQEPKPNAKVGGFARSFFQFGSNKRNKEREEATVEQGRLQERLKDVLERDRALTAASPALDDLADDTRPTQQDLRATAFAEEPPQTGTRRSDRGASELALSQIASWIEEEIGELQEEQGPLSLEVPLDAEEVAEIDAVLAAPPLASLEPSQERAAYEGEALEPAVLEPSALEPMPEATDVPVRKAKAARAASPRATVKAKVSEPVEAEVEEQEPRGEPIKTRTMARLLAMQGYKPRAIAVYRELLKRSPDDPVLLAELEALLNSD